MYAGLIADSARWHDFEPRPDDIIITTPSKCGTTWTQTLVGSLLFGRSDFGQVSEISLWFDACLRSPADAAAIVAAQSHRRFLKTHAPLDGIPRFPGVTYICVVRHPLDVALSRFDHRGTQDHERTEELRAAADESPWLASTRDQQPTEPGDFVRWWIDNDRPHLGAGALGLADYCNQANTYWEARHDDNVHLFHYSDMWNDLAGQVRRLAGVLDVAVSDDKVAEVVEGGSLSSMRGRSAQIAPEAHLGIWKSTDAFFSQGGTRNWRELLSDADLEHFHDRLTSLAPDATPWILGQLTMGA